MSFYSTIYPFGTPPISTSIIDAGTFGIDPTGTNDSYPGLQAALNAARSTGASTGIVLIPPGTFRLSQTLVPKDGTVIMGSGMYSTTLLAPANVSGATGYAFYAAQVPGSYYNSLTIRDLQIDGTNQYRPGGTPGILQPNVPGGAQLQGINNLLVENVSVKNPAGYGLLVGAGGYTPAVTSVTLRHIRITGEWNGNDAIGGGSIENFLVDDFWATNCYGAGMTVQSVTFDTRRHIRVTNPNLTVNSTNTPNANGVVSASVVDADWYDITVDNAMFGVIFGYGPTLTGRIRLHTFSLTNIQNFAIWFNSPKGSPMSNVHISDGYLSAWNKAGAWGYGMGISGGSYFNIHDVNFGTPGTPGSAAMQLTMDGGHGSGGTPFNHSVIHHCDVSQTGGIYLQDVDLTTTRLFNNPGFNPQGTGVTQPTVGTSPWTFTNNYGSDAIVNVFGGTVSSITIGSQATGRTSGEFFLPVGMSMTITYTAAPTVNVYVN